MLNIRDHTVLLTLTGSRAYGIHSPDSDFDLKGVAIPPIDRYFGLHEFEQADKPEQLRTFMNLIPTQETPPQVEGSVYEIRKFVRLAVEANPNILDILFCREEDVLFANPIGARLRRNRHLFLSAKAKHTFSGYAVAQLKRIQIRKERIDSGEVFAEDHGSSRLALEHHYGYNTKHAAHLVRLLRMGVEIMETGRVNVHRGTIDADELKEIRRGAWSYERVVDCAKELDLRLTDIYARKAYAVPHTPNIDAINTLCTDLVESYFAPPTKACGN